MPERLPYFATEVSVPYRDLKGLPVVIVLDNVRSMYNAGAFFRSADGVACQKLHLCGITPRPPKSGVLKTALGAQESVAWEYHSDARSIVERLRQDGYEISAVETSIHSVDLFDWRPSFPVCILFGHEVDGLSPDLLALCDTHVRIPMLGRKHSLNVATAGGIVLYELLRKYREMLDNAKR